MKQLLGTKVGMTQVFTTQGKKVPVTVVYVEPNRVLGVKTEANDGYVALQVGYDQVDEKKVNKPELGLFKKLNVEPYRFVREFRGVEPMEIGSEIKCDIFEAGELVDVQGTTKGHGFTGSIKRHNYSIGSNGHGAGYPHRYVGSIAFGRGGSQGQRVAKGTKLPGHYGHETVTTKNLTVVAVDAEKNLLLIKGSIPGPNGSLVNVKTSVNKPNKRVEIEMINRSVASTKDAE